MPIYQSYFNPFGTDILLTEKPRGWFLPAEAENSNRRKTFEIKMQMERQRKSSSSSVICQTFLLVNQLSGFSVNELPNV